MRRLVLTVLATIVFSTQADANTISLGIFGGSDGSSGAANVVSELGSTGLFTSTILTGNETTSQLSSYNVILDYSNGAQGFPTFGDALAGYVDNGGHLVAATFLYQTLAPAYNQSYGQLETGGYLPYASYVSNYSNANIATNNVGGPLPVNSLTANYRDVVTLSADDNVLATWSDGSPLVDVNSKDVYGLFLFPDLAGGGSTGDASNFIADTLVLAVNGQSSQDIPEPASLALLVTSLIGFGAVRRRKAA